MGALLARIDKLLPLRCRKRGGELRIIAFITERPVMQEIPGHLGAANIRCLRERRHTRLACRGEFSGAVNTTLKIDHE